MDTIEEQKAAARAEALARRGAIPAEERRRRSAALCGRLLDELAGVLPADATLAAYSALGSEVDLSQLIAGAYERGWRVALPCMVKPAAVGPAAGEATVTAATSDPAAGEAAAAAAAAAAGAPGARTPSARMAFLQVDRAAFAAREAPFLVKPAHALPADDPLLARMVPVAPAEMDAVLVPMVAFDGANNRLGYGGGNYDRFLGALRADALVVGVAFREQHADALPTQPHDLPLPRIELA